MTLVTNNKVNLCPCGAFIVLLLTPFLSIAEGHHHRERISLYNGTKNDTFNSLGSLYEKYATKYGLKDTIQIRTEPETPYVDSAATYAPYNKSCYQCLYEEQLEIAMNHIFSNDSLRVRATNNSCFHCLAELEEYPNKTKSVGCMCGLYTTQSPDLFDVPLKTKVFENVSCHELVPFEEACKKVCILSSLAHSELEPWTLCYHLHSAMNVRAYVESKICKEGTQWVFTGLTTPNPICCDQGLAIDCQK